MKPEHFIREFGVEKARKVVEGRQSQHLWSFITLMRLMMNC